jgi:hypothetical protein
MVAMSPGDVMKKRKEMADAKVARAAAPVVGGGMANALGDATGETAKRIIENINPVVPAVRAARALARPAKDFVKGLISPFRRPARA